MVVQRLRRIQLVPGFNVRIGQAEKLPGQIKPDRHKPTYREIDELPDTNISGVTCFGHTRNWSNTRSPMANSKSQIRLAVKGTFHHRDTENNRRWTQIYADECDFG